ncbi:MAG TPA: response regulator [Rhodocyclaceae bacterium]|nr:response regulator [Rhodocyclaceae bacterium]
MPNKSIERMVFISFSASVSLTLVISGIAWHSSYSAKEASQWVGHTHEVLSELQQIASDLYRAESSQRAYFITGRDDPYLIERQAALKSLEETIDYASVLTRDNPYQQKQIATLEEAIKARTQTQDRTLKLYSSTSNLNSPGLRESMALGTSQMMAVARILSLMRDEEMRLLSMRESEADTQHLVETICFATLVPLVILLLCFLFYRIRNDMRKRARAEAAQQKLIAILDATPDLVAMAESDMQLSYLNRAGRRILGLSDQAPIGHLGIADVTPHDDIYGEDRFSVANQQGVWRGETALTPPNGEPIPTLQVIMAHPLPNGTTSYSTIAHDIRERHRSEIALREAALYEESHSHALALFSSTFDRREILDGVLSLLAQRHPFPLSAIYLHDDWRGCYVCEASRGLPLDMKREFRSGEGLLGEAAARKEVASLPEFKDSGMRLEIGLGATQPAAVIIVPIIYQNRSIGVISLAASRALTERDHIFIERLATQLGAALHNVKLYADTRLLAEQLRVGSEEIAHKNAELEQASQTKSEFLANMSHELRTPLNSIIGFSDVLKAGIGGELNDKQLDYIGRINQSGQHLLALINDILDLSKVEAGKMELALSTVNIQNAINASLAIVREIAVQRRIQLSVEVEQDLSGILADERKFKQILYNLLSNAIKFSREDTQVRIFARRVPRSEVGMLDTGRPHRALPMRPGDFDDFLEITVADQGIGISQEGLDRLFQPFTQVDSSLSRKFEGTGLGLVMIMRLAELHGGSAGVSSQEGEGSSFTVWLPLREGITISIVKSAENTAAPLASKVTKTRQATGRVLVVEDDDKAAELIRLQLEAEGLQIERASTAEEALALAKKEKFSLVTLDILLPGMDGWEFLARIKESPETASLPVVIISVVADENRGLSLGASAILQKPITHQMLVEALDGLGLKRSPGEKLNVLVVDDDPRSVEIIASYLNKADCTAIRTYGGRDGIVTATKLQPDLIVLDLMMPDMSGFEVVEALKSDKRTARIPILVVTAKQIVQADRDILNGNVMQIIEKSEFNHGRFISEVRRVLGSS